VEIEYDGDTDVTGFTGPLAPRSDFDSEIEFPAVVTFGYGVTIGEKLRVGADVEWFEFSRFDELPVDVGVNGAFGLFPPSVPQDWDDIWTFGLGADYQLSDEWILRAGWIYLESPIPEETLAPTLPDEDRSVFSVGAGYSAEQHGLDVAYAISDWDRDIDSNLNPATIGGYDATFQIVQVSYTFAF